MEVGGDYHTCRKRSKVNEIEAHKVRAGERAHLAVLVENTVFGSQMWLTTSVILVSGDLTPSSGLHKSYMQYTYMYESKHSCT